MKGFSLIEMMIALAIIGMLSAFCIPIYTQHIVHAKRFEAEMILSDVAAAFEKYYTANNSYKTATLKQLGFADMIANDRYHLVILSAEDDGFQIAAYPQGKQVTGDSACAGLILDSLGKKSVTGTASVDECWR